MNPIAGKYGAPLLAAVNLVPKSIGERKRLRTVRLAAMMAVVASIAIVALGYMLSVAAKQQAKDELATAIANQNQVIAERDSKADVYDTYVEREQASFALAQAGWAEVDYTNLTTEIGNTARGTDASFVTITFTGPTAIGVGGSAELLYGTGVGTVDFVATAVSPEAASALLARLEALPGIAQVRGTTESFAQDGAETRWRIEGTAAITRTALTFRLAPDASLSGIDIVLLASLGLTDGTGPAAIPGDATTAPPPAAPATTEPTAAAGSEG